MRITEIYLKITPLAQLLKRLQVEPETPRTQLQLPQCGLIEYEHSRQLRMCCERRIMYPKGINGQQHVCCRTMPNYGEWSRCALHVGIVINDWISFKFVKRNFTREVLDRTV